MEREESGCFSRDNPNVMRHFETTEWSFFAPQVCWGESCTLGISTTRAFSELFFEFAPSRLIYNYCTSSRMNNAANNEPLGNGNAQRGM